MPLSESAIISAFLKHLRSQGELPLGDDAGAVRVGNKWLVATSDMLVRETDVPEVMTPEQVGLKAVTMNVSDVVAMGARPLAFLFSLGVPGNVSEDYVEGIAEGIERGLKLYGLPVISGDTNEACDLIIDGVALGLAERLVTRSGARVGDVVCVSGDLGRPLAALLAMKMDIQEEWMEDLLEKMLEPRARVDLLDGIRNATSAIDISDGLAKEVNTLAKMSRVSISVEADLIPIRDSVNLAARVLGIDPLELALRSGEEFEILATFPPGNVPEGFRVIGHVSRGSGVHLIRDGEVTSLPPLGWEHLSAHGTRWEPSQVGHDT